MRLICREKGGLCFLKGLGGEKVTKNEKNTKYVKPEVYLVRVAAEQAKTAIILSAKADLSYIR